MPILYSIFFCVTSLAAYLSLLLVRKSDAAQNLVAWLPMVFIALLAIDAVVAGLFSLVGIPVNILSSGIVNAVLAAVLFFRMKREHRMQQWRCDWVDVAALLLCVMVTVCCGFMQFGFGLDIHYNTSDPAAHLSKALQIVKMQSVSAMYLIWYLLAMMIEVVSPFLDTFHYFKVFIACDIFMFLLSGLAFYALISRFKTGRKWFGVVLLGLIVLYMAGYPFNNMLFGFCYLGGSVTACALMLFAGNLMQEDGIERRWGLLLIALSLAAVAIGYTLFIPVICIASFVVLINDYRRRGLLFTRSAIIEGLLVFCPALVLAIVFSVTGMSVGTTVTDAMGREGAVYRDLYSDFLITAPLFLYAAYRQIKNRRISFTGAAFLVCLAAILIAFGLTVSGRISTYYYFKFYFLMWMLAFAMTAEALGDLSATDARPFVISYCSIWIAVMLLAVSGLDEKLNEYNNYLEPQAKAWNLLDIYESNIIISRYDDNLFSEDEIDLFIAARGYSDQAGAVVPMVAEYGNILWYQDIAGVEETPQYSYWVANTPYVENLSRCEYVGVMYGNDVDVPGLSDFLEDNDNVVFSNPAGYIIKVGE